MAILDRLKTLACGHPVLAQISGSFIERRGIHRCLAPGELLYQSGVAANGIHFVLRGALQIEYPRRGATRGRAIAIVTAPGVLGECQTIFRREWSGTGVSLQELDVITFERAALFELLHDFPMTATALYCELAWQFLAVIDRRRAEPVLEPQQQVRDYLLDLRTIFSSAENSNPWLPVTQSEVARSCGMSRETVARMFAQWRAKKKVESKRGRVRLTASQRRSKRSVSIISRAHDLNDLVSSSPAR